MSYGILLWGSASNFKLVFILQTKAIKSIYNIKQRDSVRDIAFFNLDLGSQKAINHFYGMELGFKL